MVVALMEKRCSFEEVEVGGMIVVAAVAGSLQIAEMDHRAHYVEMVVDSRLACMCLMMERTGFE